MPLDLGRITHLLEQMHRSEDDAGDPIPEGMHLVTDGAAGFTWEDVSSGGGPAGETQASDVDYDNTNSGADADDVQEGLDDLYELLGYSATIGSLTFDNSPAVITNDSTYNAFPGLAWLSGGPRDVGSRALVVYRKGTDHASTNDGKIVGKIGTVTDTTPWTFSWGTEFDIYNHATLDVRCEDAVSVITGSVYIAGRLYDGSDNQAPFVLKCDDAATALTSSSSWTRHDITMSQGSVQNYSQGRVILLADGTYGLAVGWDSGGTHSVGIAIVDDPTDWSAPTFHTIGSGANDYSEININVLSGGVLRAHAKGDTNDDHYGSTSTDNGVTWTALSSLFDATGYPMFRRLQSGIMLTVYRSNAGSQDAARRFDTDGDDSDNSYGSESIIDSTGNQMEYASALQLDSTHVLVAYGVQNSGSDADIRSQVVTDSSTFATHISHDTLSDVSANDHHNQAHVITGADHTASGLTTGHVLTATSASTFAFQANTGSVTAAVLAAHGVMGAILISDTPSTPLVFGDLLQNEAQDDLLYADLVD